MLDLAVWWTGACVLGAGAALAAASLFAVLVIGAAELVWIYGRKAWDLQRNVHHMHDWVNAGKPRWHFEHGQPTQMRPTTDA